MIRDVGIVWTSDAYDGGGDRSVIGFYAILRPTVCLFRAPINSMANFFGIAAFDSFEGG